MPHSPADVNFEETLNTLKYANRARNIQNKPVVNRDPNSAKLEQMRARIKELEAAVERCECSTCVFWGVRVEYMSAIHLVACLCASIFCFLSQEV